MPVIDETTPHKPDYGVEPNINTCTICNRDDDKYHPHNPVLYPTVAVDFDGTLCDMEFPLIGNIKPGAKAALQSFRDLGYRIIIWSCRTCHYNYDVFGGDPRQPTLERERVKDMIAWLDKHGIPYDEVDDGSRGKPGADYYIDDKAIRFDDNWNDISLFVAGDTAKRKLAKESK